MKVNQPDTFTTDWQMSPPWTQKDLVVDEVLYRCDEPIFFSVRIGPLTLLMQKSALSAERDLHIGAIVDPAVVAAMKRDEISVRAAMTGGPIYVIDLEGAVMRGYWNVSVENLGSRHLPAEGVCLGDYHAVGADGFTLSTGPEGTTVTPTVIRHSPSS